MRKFLNTKTIILLILIIGIQSCIEEPKTHNNSAKGNFKALWEIIDTRYCYLDYKNIDWDSVYHAYKPRIDTVKNQFQLFQLFGEMLAVLKDGHINLYSSFNRTRYWNWYTDYPKNFNSSLLDSDRYLGDNYKIAGGIKYKKIANKKVGYIYYNSFSNGFNDTNIYYIFRHFKNCDGLIIDVRSNGGGSLSYAEMLASYFFKEKTLTGYISHKTGLGHSDFSKPKPIYTKPSKALRWEKAVIVLTNRMSYSATNDFVNRMKLAPNCIILGDVTGGGGGIPLSSELPNGWMVRFSASPIFDANMKHIEWGIAPNVQVEMNKEDEKKGYDTLIEQAVLRIKSISNN
ncbi:MAG: peptidase S41 [Paludibacter sp.]|nr:MAG: peptidase S41 [Paludibacter sp.]